MLTQDDVKALNAPFPGKAHMWTRGLVYLREQNIYDRLNEVDPCWSSVILKVDHREDQVYVHFRLTIKGVSRDNVGSALVERKWILKAADDKSPATEWIQREVNEAEKSATTDAFKRAARAFGIGAYILNIPKDVQAKKSAKALDDFLFPSQRPAPSAGSRHDAPALPAAKPVVPTSMVSANVQAAILNAAHSNPFLEGGTRNGITAALKAAGFTNAPEDIAFLFANIVPGVTLKQVSDAYPHITPDEFLKRIPAVAAAYKAHLEAQTQPDPDDDPTPVGTRNGASAPSKPASAKPPATQSNPFSGPTYKVDTPLNGSGGRRAVQHPLVGERVEIHAVRRAKNKWGETESGKWWAYFHFTYPAGDIVQELRLTLWPEDARKLKQAGYDIDWPEDQSVRILTVKPHVILEHRRSCGLAISTVDPAESSGKVAS